MLQNEGGEMLEQVPREVADAPCLEIFKVKLDSEQLGLIEDVQAYGR